MMKQLPAIAAGAGLHASEEPFWLQILHLKSEFKVYTAADTPPSAVRTYMPSVIKIYILCHSLALPWERSLGSGL